MGLCCGRGLVGQRLSWRSRSVHKPGLGVQSGGGVDSDKCGTPCLAAGTSGLSKKDKTRTKVKNPKGQRCQ